MIIFSWQSKLKPHKKIVLDSKYLGYLSIYRVTLCMQRLRIFDCECLRRSITSIRSVCTGLNRVFWAFNYSSYIKMMTVLEIHSCGRRKSLDWYTQINILRKFLISCNTTWYWTIKKFGPNHTYCQNVSSRYSSQT